MNDREWRRLADRDPRIQKLPAWARDLIAECEGHIGFLERQLAELRAATEARYETSEVRLIGTTDENDVNLPPGSEIAFGLNETDEIAAKVTNGALRLTGIGDLMVLPVNSFTIDVREVPTQGPS